MKIRRRAYFTTLLLTDPEVAHAVSISEGMSLQSARRRAMLYRLARNLPSTQQGDVIEAGVHKGGTAVVLGLALVHQPRRTLHLFDRWGDLPNPTIEDGSQYLTYRRDRIAEKLRTLENDDPLFQCRRLLHERARIPEERARYHPGWFEETFAAYTGPDIALAHLDCDYYESTELALALIAQHGVPGCLIVVDDYESWVGTRKAVDEFCRANRILPEAFGKNGVLLALPAHTERLRNRNWLAMSSRARMVQGA